MKIPVLYGITHDTDGRAQVRVPRVTKVGIGLPKGVRAHVFIDPDTGKWTLRKLEAAESGKPRWVSVECSSRQECEMKYAQAIRTSPEQKYPIKLPYFYFTKPNADGGMDPDWDAIEAHGPRPTELDIVFLDEEPFTAAFEWWSASECQCRGNGKDAQRLVKLAKTEEERRLAAVAQREGKRYFPIIGGCYNYGCEYARPKANGDKESAPLCKPHGRLQFQLMHALSIGGTAQFDTTSYRSVSNLFSCLMIFATWTGKGNPLAGRISGIPLKLVLRAHHTRMGGAYNVSLEFRAETVGGLLRQLGRAAADFRIEQMSLQRAVDLQALPAPDPGLPEVPETEEEFEAMAREGAAMTSEFYDDDSESAPLAEAKPIKQVERATNDKAVALSDRIASIRAKRGGAKQVAAVVDEFGAELSDLAEAETASTGVLPLVENDAECSVPADILALDREEAGARLGELRTRLLAYGLQGAERIRAEMRRLGIEGERPRKLADAQRLIWALEMALSDLMEAQQAESVEDAG